MRFILVLTVLCALLASSRAVEVTLLTQNELGEALPARLHVTDALGSPFPGYPDSSYLSHGRMGGYFYSMGTVTMELPSGPTTIGAMHGFEHEPFEDVVVIEGDTTLVVTLPKRFGLRQLGWYAGDMHSHTIHEPVDFVVSPYGVLRTALAEDLRMVWVLDSGHEFTGGPHAISTPEHIIYYTVEYRNQAYGHVALLGLVTHFGDWCCGPPNLPAYPMLTYIHDDWSPGFGQVMCLAHPQTGGDFFNDETWPGVGLGRELPVMAVMGTLDGLELASYSNNPDLFMEDWYGLLNCGLRVPGVAGTDAVMCNYNAPPLGGHRVYVYEGLDQSHHAGRWTEALKQGKTFVTNFPLIPCFEVAGAGPGAGPGEEVLLEQAVNEVDVELRVESIFGLDAADLIFNGTPLLSIPDPCQNEAGVLDTTVTVSIDRSGWLALSVAGETDAWGPVSPELYAHTSPIYLTVPDSDVSSTLDAGYFLDWIDSLEVFVEVRGHWGEGQRAEVLATLEASRDVFRTAFREPPLPFELIAPEENAMIGLDEAVEFDWQMNGDSEPGDRVMYRLEVAENPEFLPLSLGILCEAAPQTIPAELFDPDRAYWWRVRAFDRADNQTMSTPGASPFETFDSYAGVPGEEAAGVRIKPHAVLWPAPAVDRLHLQLVPADASITRMRVLDSSGRVVREMRGDQVPVQAGLRRAGTGHFSGLLRDSFGHPLTTGRYWIQLEGRLADDAAASAGGPTWRQSAPILIVR